MGAFKNPRWPTKSDIGHIFRAFTLCLQCHDIWHIIIRLFLSLESNIGIFLDISIICGYPGPSRNPRWPLKYGNWTKCPIIAHCCRNHGMRPIISRYFIPIKRIEMIKMHFGTQHSLWEPPRIQDGRQNRIMDTSFKLLLFVYNATTYQVVFIFTIKYWHFFIRQITQ